MDLEEQLDFMIKLHADYHSGKPGLSDQDFKDSIKELINKIKETK